MLICQDRPQWGRWDPHIRVNPGRVLMGRHKPQQVLVWWGHERQARLLFPAHQYLIIPSLDLHAFLMD